jgi:hypothetical protein
MGKDAETKTIVPQRQRDRHVQLRLPISLYLSEVDELNLM